MSIGVVSLRRFVAFAMTAEVYRDHTVIATEAGNLWLEKSVITKPAVH